MAARPKTCQRLAPDLGAGSECALREWVERYRKHSLPQSAQGRGLIGRQGVEIELKWAFGFPGATALYGQTIVDGKSSVPPMRLCVLIYGRGDRLHHWSVPALAVVRSGLTIGPIKLIGQSRGIFRESWKCVRARRLEGECCGKSPVDNQTLRRHRQSRLIREALSRSFDS